MPLVLNAAEWERKNDGIIPPLRANESVRAAAEAALMESETLSGFVLEANGEN